MLLGDLLDDPELGLSLLTGEELLDCPVHDIYITDLIDPRRYLHGGELVLSGLVWHSGPEDSESFAAALADAGVAGLAAGTARLGKAPTDLVEACTRHGVPVFEVPLAVSFNTLSERVLRAGRPDAGPRRELVTAVASGAGPARVLELAATELGTDCWVLSGAGSVVGGRAPLPTPLRHLLVREFLGCARLPATVRTKSGEDFVLWPVGPATELRPARWFAVVRGDHRQWDAERESAVTDLGTATALLRSRLDEGRQAAGRPIGSALQGLLDGTAGTREVAARLQAAGLPAGASLRVVALGAGGSPESAAALLREIADSTGLASVTAASGDGALALFTDPVPGTGRQPPAEEQVIELSRLDERLRGIVDDIEHGNSAVRLTLGISDTSDADGLRGAVEEARYARGLAGHRPGRCGLATAGELASHQVLLSAVPDELRRSYRRRLLGRLSDYDRAHHSDLEHTLDVFLECAGSWSRCSKRLHVHVNTLRYRIQRVEEITGRDLSDFSTRVDFYLALRVD